MTKKELGSSLLMAMSMGLLMSGFGYLAMNAVNNDQEQSAADRSSQKALQVAEAGISWALERLRTTYNFETNTPLISNGSTGVLDAAAINGAVDTDCLGGTSCPLHNWRQISGGKLVSFSGEFFWVAALDDDDGDQNTASDNGNEIILIRSWGRVGLDATSSSYNKESAQRVIEIAIHAD